MCMHTHIQSGLTSVADTVVGGNIGSGLSGGQVHKLKSFIAFTTEYTVYRKDGCVLLFNYSNSPVYCSWMSPPLVTMTIIL